jgi:hypothetical protein
MIAGTETVRAVGTDVEGEHRVFAGSVVVAQSSRGVATPRVQRPLGPPQSHHNGVAVIRRSVAARDGR